MSRNIWIGIVVVVILAAGAWWYLDQSNVPAISGATQIPTQQTTPNASTQTSGNLPIAMLANPNSGTAPLAVAISGSGNLFYGNLKLDFGDGNVDTSNDFISADSYGNKTLRVSHTYTSPGTYSINLLGQSCAGAPMPICGSFSTIGTVTVTVH